MAYIDSDGYRRRAHAAKVKGSENELHTRTHFFSLLTNAKVVVVPRASTLFRAEPEVSAVKIAYHDLALQSTRLSRLGVPAGSAVKAGHRIYGITTTTTGCTWYCCSLGCCYRSYRRWGTNIIIYLTMMVSDGGSNDHETSGTPECVEQDRYP